MSNNIQQDDLCFMSISDLAPLIESGDISPVELATAVLNRIDEHNAEMRAFITVTREVALDQAHAAEKEIASGRYRGPLHGVPVSLKDNILTKGIRTSCGSMVNPDWVPDRDATVYQKLRQAGAVLVGKTNLREYAFASLNPAFPPPINPWHRDRTSGGSSSGSAVAVASGMGYASLGTDTGGSGRTPATQNGVVGIKGTYGRVSRTGVFPLSYSFDHTTVLARTVRDSAIVLQAVSGFDLGDENSAREPVPDFCAKVGRDLTGMRIGVARGFTYNMVDSEVAVLASRAIGIFKGLGAQVSELELPYLKHCLPVFQPIMTAEAATIHYETLRKAPEKLGSPVRTQLDLGSLVPATVYLHAQRVRKLMRDAFRDVLKRCDVIVAPALAGRPGPAGKFTMYIDDNEVDDLVVTPEYTGLYNLTGMPALALPSGFGRDGTPIGIQIAGAWFDEATVFQAAHAYEQATEWHKRRPPHPTTVR